MSSLFDDDLPTIRTTPEFEAFCAEHPNINRYYLASALRPERRALFDSLWRAFEPYADSHLLPRIKTNFHDCTWEIYVGAMLLAHGMSLVHPGDNGPDIRVEAPVKMLVEAIAVGAGRVDAVPEMSMDGSVHDVPERQLLLRVTGGLGTKLEQHLRHLKDGVASPDVPFVIALNRGALVYPEDDAMPLIVKGVFGAGPLVIPLQPGGVPYRAERLETPREDRPPVSSALFRDPAFASVSACLYSHTAVVSHPEPLGGDCVIVHNPNATNPLPAETFSFLDQWFLDGGDTVRRLTAAPIDPLGD